MAEGRCALKLELSLVSCGLATNSSILSSSSLESTFEELEDKVREAASCFTIGFVLKGAKVRLLWTGETGPLRMSLSCLMVFSRSRYSSSMARSARGFSASPAL